VGTPTSLAALPLATQAKVPFFAPFTGAQALRDPFNRYAFHVRASYFDETAAIVRQLTELGLKKIAVLRQDDSYGQAGLDGVQRALAAKGLEPAAVGLVKRNTVDVAAAEQAILPKRPDAIVLIAAYKSCAAFIREARKAGFGGTFYNVSFVGAQALADELGPQGKGVAISQVMPHPFSSTSSLAREYLHAIGQAGGGAKPNYTSMEGYVAAKVFTEGLKRAGRGATRDNFITGIESIQHHDLGGFQLNFGAHNHAASQFVELTMLTEDGRVKR
jgi:ABC-type branched-subunit amino acid transport system substrate-binding protein